MRVEDKLQIDKLGIIYHSSEDSIILKGSREMKVPESFYRTIRARQNHFGLLNRRLWIFPVNRLVGGYNIIGLSEREGKYSHGVKTYRALMRDKMVEIPDELGDGLGYNVHLIGLVDHIIIWDSDDWNRYSKGLPPLST